MADTADRWIPLVVIVRHRRDLQDGNHFHRRVRSDRGKYYSGLVQMDPIYEKAGKMIGANRREMLYEIVIPASIPQILAE